MIMRKWLIPVTLAVALLSGCKKKPPSAPPPQAQAPTISQPEQTAPAQQPTEQTQPETQPTPPQPSTETQPATTTPPPKPRTKLNRVAEAKAVLAEAINVDGPFKEPARDLLQKVNAARTATARR